jgi:hypothetical protein
MTAIAVSPDTTDRRSGTDPPVWYNRLSARYVPFADAAKSVDGRVRSACSERRLVRLDPPIEDTSCSFQRRAGWRPGSWRRSGVGTDMPTAGSAEQVGGSGQSCWSGEAREETAQPTARRTTMTAIQAAARHHGTSRHG